VINNSGGYRGSGVVVIFLCWGFVMLCYRIPNLKYEGFSGLLHTFDLLVRKGREEHVVLVMDWKRTVGINMIIKTEKAAEDVDLAHPIIIANMFSDHAKAYSNKRE
jgi:hypothetical protein